jgi:hypothetical protein
MVLVVAMTDGSADSGGGERWKGAASHKAAIFQRSSLDAIFC